MDHVVFFSGGVGSWAAAKRVAEKHGTDNLKLLFTNTKTEDADLYRFIHEAAENVGGELIILSDGRDIWQVFKDVKLMGNSRIDPCSRILKRELADKWIKENYPDPETARFYLGIDWSEQHRWERTAEIKKPYVYLAPMCEAPYLDKNQVFDWLESEGIKRPKLYDYGFPHNNCGGFCVKTGQAQFKLLYEKRPDYYKECERKEQEVYDYIGNKRPFIRVAISKIPPQIIDKYKIRNDGKKCYLSMREFRIIFLEDKAAECDPFDFGGCGCFMENG